jgi:signal transduction histidine kinase/CheY-like chemotaxis protein
MKLRNFSIRTILGTIISMMGVLALVLALSSGAIHRDLVLNNQKLLMQEMISISAKQRLKDLNQTSQDLGLALQSTEDFNKALSTYNEEQLISILNNQFHQYFVTAGVIDLKQITLLDKNFNVLLESSDGTVFYKDHAESFCSNVFESGAKRTAADRMKIIREQCSYKNKPLNIVIVPVGGLRLKAYLMVTTNPVHNLSSIAQDLGLPVQLSSHSEKLFESESWPEDINQSIVSSYPLITSSNEDILDIAVAQNTSHLSDALARARIKVLTITGIITLLVVVLSILIIRKTMVAPLNELTEKLRNFNTNTPRIIDDHHISGTKEIYEICEGFNYMANAQHAAQESDHQKSMFLANMSHEIRTPLTAIIGFSERLYKNSKSKNWETMLQRIIVNGRHLYQLINDILDLSKIEANQLNIERLEVPICSLLYEIEPLIGEKARNKELQFDLIFDFPVPKLIKSDPTRLKQILINLCNNAVKFTEAGHVALRTSYSKVKDELTFTVSDTGIGMTEAQMNGLFTPFTQADTSTTRRFGGTGLGLYISKLLSEKLGGDIQVTSKLNEGSQFRVQIPANSIGDALINAEEEITLQVEIYDSSVPGLSGNILVAEDGLDNQQLITLYVEETGATVEIVDNGESAVEKALSNNYDLILMDMQMPVMDGIEAVKKIRQANCNTPIAMLTANAMQESILESEKAGANDFIAKPINLEQLYAVLKKHLNRKPIKNENAGKDEIIKQLEQLKAAYVKRLPDLIAKIDEMVQASKWNDLQVEIHTLKGTAGTYGFHDITEQCAIIEQNIKDGKHIEAEKLIRKLNEENNDIYYKHAS